ASGGPKRNLRKTFVEQHKRLITFSIKTTMAGVRQHIIPQFLLKGFASRTTSKAAFTWVYRKRAPPFETNIINVTVEGKFYDKDAETSADDLITDLESE